MKNLIKILLCSIFLWSINLYASNEQRDLEIVKKQFIENLLLLTPEEQTIQDYLHTLDPKTGAWSDIDYKSQVGSDWKTKKHTQRIADLAYYYVSFPETTTLFSREQVRQAIHQAWGYWFRVKPYCKTNWFPNKIACPKDLSYSFLLMQEDMTPQEVEAAQQIVFCHPTLSKTGANLLSFANIILAISLFEKDAVMVRKSIAAIESTIFIAQRGEEGIQADYSYHLHGPQQQFGNYGRAALKMYSYYANILRGTSFAFKPEYMDIITGFITEGYEWVLWNGYMDVNSSGRQFSPDALKSKGDDIMTNIAGFLKACSPQQAIRIAEVMAQNTDSKVKRIGTKGFSHSDGMYHRTPHWGASLKMSSVYAPGQARPLSFYQDYFKGDRVPNWVTQSLKYNTRVAGAEQGADNLKGYYLADGAFYTYVSGDEYENAPVLWDWRKLPGVTCYDEKGDLEVCFGQVPPNQSAFVGTCTDGLTGISSMQFRRDSIEAFKSWIVTQDFVLCLGSDIKTDRPGATLTTSIDQKLAKGDLYYLQGKQWESVKGQMTSKKADQRYHHDQTGYIVLGKSHTTGCVETRTEDWNNITRSIPSSPVTDDVMSIYIRHQKAGEGYRYVILPAYTQEQVAQFDISQLKVLRQDESTFLVSYRGVYYLSTLTAGSFKASREIMLQVAHPGLYQFTKRNGVWSICANDPTQRLTSEKMKLNLTIKED